MQHSKQYHYYMAVVAIELRVTMKVSELLLLLLSSIPRGQGPSKHECTPTDNAGLTSYGAFKIVKTRDHYIIRAQHCTVGKDCIINKNLINCNNVCDFCEVIPQRKL